MSKLLRRFLRRIPARLFTVLGPLLLLSAAIGIYSVVACNVAHRITEIGVRMAIGARKSDVVRLFVSRGMTLTMSGVGLGLLAAAALMPLMRSALFGVSPLDPFTLAAAPLVLTVVALLACYLPARRAANADPKIALRYE